MNHASKRETTSVHNSAPLLARTVVHVFYGHGIGLVYMSAYAYNVVSQIWHHYFTICCTCWWCLNRVPPSLTKIIRPTASSFPDIDHNSARPAGVPTTAATTTVTNTTAISGNTISTTIATPAAVVLPSRRFCKHQSDNGDVSTSNGGRDRTVGWLQFISQRADRWRSPLAGAIRFSNLSSWSTLSTE